MPAAVGWEQHPQTVQYFAVEQGSGVLLRSPPGTSSISQAEVVPLKEHDKVFVDPGWWHDVQTQSEIKLFAAYIPPHHPVGTVDLTRADAERRERASSTQSNK